MRHVSSRFPMHSHACKVIHMDLTSWKSGHGWTLVTLGKIIIGNQEFSVVFGTGSADLWITWTWLHRSQHVYGERRFDPSKLSTSESVGGSFKGHLWNRGIDRSRDVSPLLADWQLFGQIIGLNTKESVILSRLDVWRILLKKWRRYERDYSLSGICCNSENYVFFVLSHQSGSR